MHTKVEALLRTVTPHLRPGEAVTHTAYVERQVPALIRALRFVRFAYHESFHVAVTNERLFLMTSSGRLFGRPLGSLSAIEHADLASAENVQVITIGSTEIRLTLGNGLVYPFLVPLKSADFPDQSGFVSGYVPWLSREIAARSFVPRGSEVPRVQPLDLPPMLAHGALAVVGALFALFHLPTAATWLGDGHFGAAVFALLLAALGGAVSYFMVERIRTRSARLRGEQPVSLAALASANRKKLGLVGVALAAMVVLIGVASVVSSARRASQEAELQSEIEASSAAAFARATQERAAADARPSLSQWPPENLFPSDPPFSNPPAPDRVRARWEAYGFTVADAPVSSSLGTWSLVATSARGVRLTLSAESIESTGDVARVKLGFDVVVVRGPDPSVRERIVSRLRGETYLQQEAIAAAMRAGGIRNANVSYRSARGATADGGEYELSTTRLETSDDTHRGVRYCLTSATTGICVTTEVDPSNYTLTGDWTLERVRRAWSTWAARDAAAAAAAP